MTSKAKIAQRWPRGQESKRLETYDFADGIVLHSQDGLDILGERELKVQNILIKIQRDAERIKMRMIEAKQGAETPIEQMQRKRRFIWKRRA